MNTNILAMLLPLAIFSNDPYFYDLSPSYQLSLAIKTGYNEIGRATNSELTFAGVEQGRTVRGLFGGAMIQLANSVVNDIYTGVLVSFINARLNGWRIFDVKSELRLGYSYYSRQGQKLQVTPFVGLAHRFLYQKEPVHLAEIFKFYIPIGLFSKYKLFENIHTGIHVVWLADIDSTLKIDRARYRIVLTKDLDQLFAALICDITVVDETYKLILSCNPFWENVKEGSGNVAVEGANGSEVVGMAKQNRTYWGLFLILNITF